MANLLKRMSKPALTKPRHSNKPLPNKARSRPGKKARSKRNNLSWWFLIEVASLLFTLSLLALLFTGLLAKHFSGTDLISNLLPFSFGLVSCIVVTALILAYWRQTRIQLVKKWRYYPVLCSVALSTLIGAVIYQQGYWQDIQHFKTLVGGKQLVQSENVAHQVYAAYRRQDPKWEMQLIDRANTYQALIRETAQHYEMDADLLLGLAATESSFWPRDSQDGGHGLFQITSVAGFIQKATQEELGIKRLDLTNPRHNAYLAAATLKFYLSQMHDDLYLGLLAYNIGPSNGGLKFIMDQYGAHDFVSMQPYLQTLPRDYPIRVLSHALAFKIWQQHGKLLAYQEAQNTQLIQSLGIPGMRP